MDELIPNKVEASGLITLSLEDLYPKGSRMELDIAPWLYEGLILREKDFRQAVKEHNWEQYQGSFVSVYCSEDAIVPQWAYMLLGSALQPWASKIVYGNPEMLESILMEESFDGLDFSQYQDERIILKGCSKLPIPPNAYMSFAQRLRPFAKSIMFGEACSTVPVYKKR